MSTQNIIFVVAALAAVAFMLFKRGGDLSVEQAKQMVQDGAVLVDVRTPGEFSSGHIEGAVNIPLQELTQRAGELKKDQTIVLYCRSGSRSGQALRQLKSAGYSQVQNLGAMSRWD